jgi:hypothetical protein
VKFFFRGVNMSWHWSNAIRNRLSVNGLRRARNFIQCGLDPRQDLRA